MCNISNIMMVLSIHTKMIFFTELLDSRGGVGRYGTENVTWELVHMRQKLLFRLIKTMRKEGKLMKYTSIKYLLLQCRSSPSQIIFKINAFKNLKYSHENTCIFRYCILLAIYCAGVLPNYHIKANIVHLMRLFVDFAM